MTPGHNHHMKTKSLANFGQTQNLHNALSSVKSAFNGTSIFMNNRNQTGGGVEASPNSFGLLSKRKKIGTMSGRTNTFLS